MRADEQRLTSEKDVINVRIFQDYLDLINNMIALMAMRLEANIQKERSWCSGQGTSVCVFGWRSGEKGVVETRDGCRQCDI